MPLRRWEIRRLSGWEKGGFVPTRLGQRDEAVDLFVVTEKRAL